MFKHTQTIRRQVADVLFEGVWPFCETGAYRVNAKLKYMGKFSPCNILAIPGLSPY